MLAIVAMLDVKKEDQKKKIKWLSGKGNLLMEGSESIVNEEKRA
jgi:hypothetical protein